MPSKQTIERNIRIVSRKCYKQIRYFKMPLFVILLMLFTLLMLGDPTTETITMYVLSLIAIFFAYRKDILLKEEKRKAKEGVMRPN